MMDKHITAIMLFFIAALGTLNAEDVYFTTSPTLSPDAQKVIFSCEGDLWIVNAGGGTAYRLTGMAGEEKFPRFSPDGQWIAFSGTQDGNSNVYVMPVQGGEIKQLTFHDAEDSVESWSWDSQYIYFTSNRCNNFTAFKVSREGGTPQRLFENYFNTVHGVVEHPVSLAYYFTDTDESLTFASRKGYRGEYNPEIKSYDPKTKEFLVHNSFPGKDFWHTIDQKGNIYFVSDRYNGEYNLFQLGTGEPVRLTGFDSSIKTPQVSADGEKIVFEKDYQLYIYSIPGKKAEKIDLRLVRNDTLKLEQDFDVEGKITYFDVSPDGKKLAFVSRGELFVSDIKGKFIRKLEIGEDRVLEVKWLKDSRTLLFNQTVEGWLNLFKMRSDTGDQKIQLTFDEVNNRNIALDRELTRALYLSGIAHLKVMDLKDFTSKTVVTDEFWGYDNSQPYFSPDGRYIIFTAYRDFEEDLFLHPLESGQTLNLTNSGISENQPFWSPDGKYLFFASHRYRPFYPRGGEGFKIYRLPLHKYSQPFKSTEYDKLFQEEETQTPASAQAKSKNQENKPKAAAEPFISIDLSELMNHWEQVSPKGGTQNLLYVTGKADEIQVLYLSDHDGEPINLWKTTIKPFEANKTEKIKGAGSDYVAIVTVKDNCYALVNGQIGQVDLGSSTFSPLPMKYTFTRDLKSEFHQMFFELWAGVRENFYDETFHGKDWKDIKERYRRFLPYVTSRSDLRTLIDDMLGELNASHMGFTSRGEEEKTFHSLETMQTGVMFEDQNPYTVKGVVTDSPADKKDIEIKPGDVLTALNQKKVDPRIDRDYYFSAPSLAKELSLTFTRRQNHETRVFTVKVHPVSTRALKQKLYDEWIRDNQRYVDERSDKRIAYIHMKDMRQGELEKFLIEMTNEWYRREGLILDIRYNTGGNVHDAVLSFLSQRPYTQWKFREGKFAPQPNFAPAARPIVLLINEQSLSDAEMTAVAFKKLDLGTIIGTETYRWLIFTSGKTLVDGSYYRLPSWGCYTLDEADIEWTGAKPDIYVKTTLKDRLEGKDPQLERAIQEILNQLNQLK